MTVDRERLIEMSAATAVDAMRKGEITAEEYANALLTQAKKLEALNAFRTLKPEQVLEAAREADKTRSSGKVLGLLHGLPIPIKDSVNTKELPTSNCTPALGDFVPKSNAAVVESLLGQGAIVMGKTNLHELSVGYTTNNQTFGSVHNPYSRDRIPGGSSGGSAVAVAARMAPIAIAEDTLGSIRVPAACCGVVGLRPSYGRYPNRGIAPLTTSGIDQVGPLARAVADIALFDAAITGQREPLNEMSLKGVRIGISSAYQPYGLDPEVQRLFNEAINKLRAGGVTIVELDLSDTVGAATGVAFTIFGYQAAETLEAYLKEEKTGLTLEDMLAKAGPDAQGVLRGFAMPPNRPPKEVYDGMVIKREQLRDAIRDCFREHGLTAIAFPTIPAPAPLIGEDTEITIAGQKVSLLYAMSNNITVGSVVSMASLVLPVGLTTGGLPVTLEFDALTGADRDLLSLGLSVERLLGSIAGPKL